MSRAHTDALHRSKVALSQIADFIEPYLPLANAHNTDFIVKDHWLRLVPQVIREQLLDLSDIELAQLPLSRQFYKCTDPVDSCSSSEAAEAERPRLNVSDGALHDADGERHWRRPWDLSLIPDWQHTSLQEFVDTAGVHSLQHLEVASTLQQLGEMWKEEMSGGVFVGTFMSPKKEHEVEIMATVCAALASVQQVSKVIDIGSGRGYLSCHLAKLHGLQVLGIDSSKVNTHSAELRSTRLDKHWNGLLRNAQLQQGNTQQQLSKKQKRKQKQNVYSADVEIQHENSTTSGKYVPITLYVTQQTDLQLLLAECLDYDSSADCNRDNLQYSTRPPKEDTEKRHQKCDKICDANMCASDCDVISSPTVGRDSAEIREFRVSSTSSTTNVVEDADKTRNLRISDSGTSSGVTDSLDLRGSCVPLTSDHHSIIVDSNSRPSSSAASEFANQARLVDATTGSVHECNCERTVKSVCPCQDSSQQAPAPSKGNPPCPGARGDGRFMLTGLHTCGDLASNMLHLFASKPDAAAVCNVGCCYHHIEERYVVSPYATAGDNEPEEFGFPLSGLLRGRRYRLGRNARMLACQAIPRVTQNAQLPSYSLHYRAVLQKILLDVTGEARDDWHVGRIASKCANFSQYVHKSFEKLSISTQCLSDELIGSYEETYRVYERQLQAFFQLKMVLAPCIEALILLDRLVYLLEQENVADARIIQMFDPITSPRCHGIIAWKRDT